MINRFVPVFSYPKLEEAGVVVKPDPVTADSIGVQKVQETDVYTRTWA